MAYNGKNNVTSEVVWYVYNNHRNRTAHQLRIGVACDLGLEFSLDTINQILKGKYDEKKIGYPLDWETSSGFGGGFRPASRSNSRGGGRSAGRSNSYQNNSSDSAVVNFVKNNIVVLIIAAIVIYIFRDKILTLLMALLPIVIMLAVLAFIILIAKNMLTGRSAFAGKSAGRGRKSSGGNFSLPGICIMIGCVLMGLKLVSSGDYPAALISIGLGVFIANVSKR